MNGIRGDERNAGLLRERFQFTEADRVGLFVRQLGRKIHVAPEDGPIVVDGVKEKSLGGEAICGSRDCGIKVQIPFFAP